MLRGHLIGLVPLILLVALPLLAVSCATPVSAPDDSGGDLPGSSGHPVADAAGEVDEAGEASEGAAGQGAGDTTLPGSAPGDSGSPCASAPGRSEVWAFNLKGQGRLVDRYAEFSLAGPGLVPGSAEARVLVRPGAVASDCPSGCLILVDTEGIRHLAHLDDVRDVHWAPGGERRLVALVGATVCRLDLEGRLRVLVEDGRLYGAEIAADGRIVGLRDGGGGNLDLVVYEGDGPRIVKADLMRVPAQPEAGGRALVPLRQRPGTCQMSFCEWEGDGGKAVMHVVDLEDGQHLTFEVRGGWASAWSPDGGRVAVLGPGGVYTAEGELVLPFAVSTGHVCWSPDGQRLLTPHDLLDVVAGESRDLDLQIPQGAIVRPLGWTTGTEREPEALVLVSLPEP